jgi:hypothetical protein
VLTLEQVPLRDGEVNGAPALLNDFERARQLEVEKPLAAGLATQTREYPRPIEQHEQGVRVAQPLDGLLGLLGPYCTRVGENTAGVVQVVELHHVIVSVCGPDAHRELVLLKASRGDRPNVVRVRGFVESGVQG